MECSLTKNKHQCNGSYPCSRKGKCCDCLAYHRNMNELPACYFNDFYEKTYDRSVENYLRMIKK